MSRNRLYLLLGTLTLAGYSWLAWSLWHSGSHGTFTPCLFKSATGIACPSCGTTRSLSALIHGHLVESALINPLGIISGILMLLLPLWILGDILYRKNTLHRSYLKFEALLKVKWIAVTLTALVVLNWIWNITKGL